MRTFVFISNVPDFLLQPLYKSEAKDGAGDPNAKKSLAASKFDLRYERLRRLLVEHSTGVMLVMHLETKGYALALYASEGEALAACKADITPEQPGHTHTPLRLRILEKEKPRPPEPVYNPCLTVEGEEVRKVDLADTRGLELVYRGRALAKWCPRTLAGEDCHFGVSCLKLHKAAVQRTVRKRPRIDEDDVEAHLSTDQQRTVRRLLASVREAREALVPQTLALPNCVYVPATLAEVCALCDVPTTSATADAGPGSTTSSSSQASMKEDVYAALLQRLNAAHAPLSGAAFFPRLSCPGGTPWEWAVESTEGRRALRAVCPLPANGAPTPLERDLYIQKLWYHMNQLNRCHSAAEALRMLQGSRRVREALRQRVASQRLPLTSSSSASPLPLPVPAGGDGAVAAASSALTAGDETLFICLEPWLYLPTVGCEVTAFLERGGRRVRGVVQRYGQLRLMASATLLSQGEKTYGTPSAHQQENEEAEELQGVASAALPAALRQEDTPSGLNEEEEERDALLSRYAVLESGNDPAAEDALMRELRDFQRSIAAAVGDLSVHLRNHPDATGGDGAAWCVHLAVCPRPPPSPSLLRPSLSPSSSSSSALPATPSGTSRQGVAAASAPAVFLLSCSPYHRAMEECPLYAALAPPSAAAAAAGDVEPALRPGKTEVTWNTQRHPYIPLFNRETLEKLRATYVE